MTAILMTWIVVGTFSESGTVLSRCNLDNVGQIHFWDCEHNLFYYLLDCWCLPHLSIFFFSFLSSLAVVSWSPTQGRSFSRWSLNSEKTTRPEIRFALNISATSGISCSRKNWNTSSRDDSRERWELIERWVLSFRHWLKKYHRPHLFGEIPRNR